MKTRDTVRLLILDSEGRVLLMKIDNPRERPEDGSPRPPFWITFGGGVDEGESFAAAAVREAREETGRHDVHIERAVWYWEKTFPLDGLPTLFREFYFLARLEDDALSRDAWTPSEREVVTEVRWWTADEIGATTDTVYPDGLAQFLRSLAGIKPRSPAMAFSQDTMGTVISYDDKFATPYAEIALSSGERVVLTLDRGGLVVKAPAGPRGAEAVLFTGDPDTVAGICLGLVGDQAQSLSPLQVLVAAVTHIPEAKAVAPAFKAAAAA